MGYEPDREKLIAGGDEFSWGVVVGADATLWYASWHAGANEPRSLTVGETSARNSSNAVFVSSGFLAGSSRSVNKGRWYYWAWNASIGWVSSTGPELANTMSLVPVMNSVGTVIGACCWFGEFPFRWRFRYQLSPPVAASDECCGVCVEVSLVWAMEVGHRVRYLGWIRCVLLRGLVLWCLYLPRRSIGFLHGVYGVCFEFFFCVSWFWK